MDSSVWKLTLDQLRAAVARGPVPAGVSVCAIAATLALDLIAACLQTTGRRKSFSGDREQVANLLERVRSEADRMKHLADDDVAAYEAFLSSRRVMPGTDPSADRSAVSELALRQASEVPIKVARSAIASLELCALAVPVVNGAMAPDLGSSAALLAAAVRAAARSAEANARRMTDTEYRRAIKRERRKIETEAAALAARILKSIALRIESQG
ncbi:MAG: cyclodeaminase/cyclohydrolase family protein [Candidatus Binataceae bacterium]|nr:cyclodeaminase/cyclohydrolase family protein [Candidatus Binataceae bacterium]